MKPLHPDSILAAYGLGLDFPKRFFLKVSRTDCCWPWEGAIRDTGYSKISCSERRGPSISGQKAAWIIFNGEIPEGFELMNACPNHIQTCCNPNHWTLGKHGDIKRLRDATNPNIPISMSQMARAEIICTQSGTSLADIEALRTANHITPPWMVEAGFSENFANRFYAKVKITETCHLWTGCKNDDGYGYIGISSGTQTISAHKASFMLNKGPIPEGLDVLHNCDPNKDNPSCVNAAHLSVDTDNANALDAVKKHYSKYKKFWNTKLTREQVDEIRVLAAKGMMQKDIALKFGISPSHISGIVNFHDWNDPT